MHRKQMLTKARKGNVFTIDVILAFLIVSAVLFSSYALLSSSSKNLGINDQIQIAYDSLDVVEGSSVLEEAIITNSANGISLFLNNLPQNICGNITLYSTNAQQKITSAKSGCKNSNELSIARNVFTANNQIYYAEMKMWLNRN